MKKTGILAMLFVILMFYPSFSFSQNTEEKKEPIAQEDKKEKQVRNERMAGMMMQLMGSMQKQIVATSDGGVIVLAGNKLLKYDKDLNFVKEVEINSQFELKMDTGSMRGMMDNMKEKYGKHHTANDEGAKDTKGQ